jgi:2-alkenal reductase
VIAGGPADAAGIKEGDILTRIGEVTLDEDHSYVNALFNYAPAQTIPIQIVRDGQALELQVTLGETRTGN